ncbi:MAG: TRAP transporter small permease subunit [Desulfobacterales bacterium]
MVWLDSMATVVRKINKGFAFVGMFFLIPMMLLTTSDVIARSLFHRSVSGTYELSSYLLSVFILLGIAYTYQVGGHVQIDMFTQRLPATVKAVLEVLTTLLSLFIISILAWQGWVVGIEEAAVSEQMRIPEMPFRLLVTLAAVCLGLSLLVELIEKVCGLIRR